MIGLIEVKTIHSATNCYKINTNSYRLALFGKTAVSLCSLTKTFQVMAKSVSPVKILTT
ncbi:hypothetical protein BD770DRAFT_392834 [Pilaira anomala]|nr:hypothetical protein BD770DRAFT_392834 [Pilaira anomala]